MSNIPSLDHGRRITRERTIRAPLYEAQADGLADLDRAKLLRLEGALFCSGTRQTECRSGDLHMPSGHYECRYGTIWFHFSRCRSMFVLTAFTLADGGGGLKAEGASGEHAELRGCAMWHDEMVPRRAVAVRHPRRHRVGGRMWMALATLPKPVRSPRGGSGRCGRHEPDLSDVVVIVSRSTPPVFDANHEVRLPEWSILNGIVSVSEQVGNPYARLILTGEALCRIRGTLRSSESARGHRTIRDYDPFASHAAASLLDDSMRIIEALSERAADRLARVSAESYVTSCLMDRDGLGYGRDLCLVQSEMTMRFADVVAEQAGALLSGAGCTVGEPHMSRLMRKFALLGRFAVSSSWYFGTTLFRDDACFRSSDRRMHTAGRGDILDIRHFGLSTDLIVRHLVDDDRSLPQGDEMEIMRDRLLAMVREIVDPI